MKPLPFLAALALTLPLSAAGAQGWPAGKVVAITMTDRGFVPARVVLRSGRPYTLRFRNASAKGHNFTAREFWKLARVSPRDGAWVAKNEVSLDAGQQATVHIVAPTTPGARYRFRSTVLADAGDGFKGAIFVR